jgi:hypothetical protein
MVGLDADSDNNSDYRCYSLQLHKKKEESDAASGATTGFWSDPDPLNSNYSSVMQNNPGNIEGNNEGFQGQIPSSNQFASFDTAANGFRAILVTIHTKIVKDGLNTITALITSYAPPEDNNPTAQYIANVSAWTGIPALQVLDESFYSLDASNGITGLAKAIVRQEGNTVSDADVETAFASYQSDYL